jgi:hypothetical protein
VHIGRTLSLPLSLFLPLLSLSGRAGKRERKGKEEKKTEGRKDRASPES